MEDEDEEGEDDPVELVDQPEIWSSVLHQAEVGEEDEESTEENVEAHDIHVHISRGEPSLSCGLKYESQIEASYLDEQSAKNVSAAGVFDSQCQPTVSQKGNRTANC